MKIRTLSRSKREHTRERPQDLQRVYRNVSNSNLHPFTREREYVRARNAVKLDKMFAKPFVGALEGHADGVYAMTTSSTSLVGLITGTLLTYIYVLCVCRIFFFRFFFRYRSNRGHHNEWVVPDVWSSFSHIILTIPVNDRISSQAPETEKFECGTWHIDVRFGAFERIVVLSKE